MFLILQGTNSHIFSTREDILSVPNYTVWLLSLCRVESFLRLYGFCTKWKMTFIISGPKSFPTYKFLLPTFVESFGEYLLICPFSANHQKRDLFYLYGQVLKLFVSIVNSIVDSPTTGHPNKREVRKLIPEAIFKSCFTWAKVTFLFISSDVRVNVGLVNYAFPLTSIW